MKYIELLSSMERQIYQRSALKTQRRFNDRQKIDLPIAEPPTDRHKIKRPRGRPSKFPAAIVLKAWERYCAKHLWDVNPPSIQIFCKDLGISLSLFRKIRKDSNA